MIRRLAALKTGPESKPRASGDDPYVYISKLGAMQ